MSEELNWKDWKELDDLHLSKKKDLIYWMLVTQQHLIEEVKEERAAEFEMKRLIHENEELKKERRVERMKFTKETNKLKARIAELEGDDESPEPEEKSKVKVVEAKPGATTKIAAAVEEQGGSVTKVVPAKAPKVKKQKKAKTTPVPEPETTAQEAVGDPPRDERTLSEVPEDEVKGARKHLAEMDEERLTNFINSDDPVPWHLSMAKEELARRKEADAPATPSNGTPKAPKAVPTNISENAQIILDLMTAGEVHEFDNILNSAKELDMDDGDFYMALSELQEAEIVEFPEQGKILLNAEE